MLQVDAVPCAAQDASRPAGEHLRAAGAVGTVQVRASLRETFGAQERRAVSGELEHEAPINAGGVLVGDGLGDDLLGHDNFLSADRSAVKGEKGIFSC
jgi:hypothetical protein